MAWLTCGHLLHSPLALVRPRKCSEVDNRITMHDRLLDEKEEARRRQRCIGALLSRRVPSSKSGRYEPVAPLPGATLARGFNEHRRLGPFSAQNWRGSLRSQSSQSSPPIAQTGHIHWTVSYALNQQVTRTSEGRVSGGKNGISAVKMVIRVSD